MHASTHLADRYHSKTKPRPVRLDPADGLLHLDRPQLDDVPAIEGLLKATVPDCLPQTPQEIQSQLAQYEVARHHKTVIATASLRQIDRRRAELRGIAVDPNWQGCGLGQIMVQRTVFRALQNGFLPVCVTRKPGFFAKMGFHPIPLEAIPTKKSSAVTTSSTRPRVAMAWQASNFDQSSMLLASA